MGMLDLVSVILVVVLILYGSYLFTRSIGKRSGIKGRGSLMQMMDRMSLGQDKSVAIVRIGQHYYLIGIASAQVNLMAELSGDDLYQEGENKHGFTD